MEEELKFSKYIATFDSKICYPQIQLPDKTEKLEFKAQHEFLSISMFSNVPGYQEPKCFIVPGEGRECALQAMMTAVDHLKKIANTARELELQRFALLLKTTEETLCDGATAFTSWAEESEEELGDSTGFDDDSDSKSDDAETKED